MTLPSSPNAISIEDVYNEFGPSAIAGSTLASAPYGLDEFYSLGNKTSYFTGRTVTSVPNSSASAISLQDFYGKSRDLQFNVIGVKSNWIDGYPASFTFTTGTLTGNQRASLGFVPGGSLNRWYIVFMARDRGNNLPGVTMSFDGAAAVGATHTASGTYTITNKSGTTTLPVDATVSVWLYKKNTGSTLTITTNNNTAYQMSVFEVYTTHNMTAANRTFYTGSGNVTSFSVSSVDGGLFIQSATNDENSDGPLLQGAWSTLTYTTAGNGWFDNQIIRDGNFGRRASYAATAATFFTTAAALTFTVNDPRDRTGVRTQVSAGIFIRP
jgi:hypothetical protein